MITYKTATHVFSFGADAMDVERWLETSRKTWSSSSAVTTPARHDWDLGVGYDGAKQLVRTGWSEGAKDLSDKLEAHMPARDKETSWRYDVAGELPDIGRFLAGDPSCMKRHGHPKGHRPVISLAVNIAVNASVSATSMANYGAAMVAVIDKLEHSGRRVDLSVIMVAVQGTRRNVIGWRVKKAEDPLDLAAVAFAIAHPAALRRIGFAMYEHSDSPTWVGYGQQTQAKVEDVPDPAPNTFCLPGLAFGRAGTLDQAITLVRTQINDAAGEELVTVEG
jgi:hypothetical protein